MIIKYHAGFLPMLADVIPLERRARVFAARNTLIGASDAWLGLWLGVISGGTIVGNQLWRRAIDRRTTYIGVFVTLCWGLGPAASQATHMATHYVNA